MRCGRGTASSMGAAGRAARASCLELPFKCVPVTGASLLQPDVHVMPLQTQARLHVEHVAADSIELLRRKIVDELVGIGVVPETPAAVQSAGVDALINGTGVLADELRIR